MHALMRETEGHRSSPIELNFGPDELIPLALESGVPDFPVLG